MNERFRLSRRQWISAWLAAGTAGNQRLWRHAAAQGSPWTPANGLRLAGPYEGLATLDPARSRDLQTNFIVRQICRGLIGYDEQLTPVPELAESVDIADDQRVYTFVLRHDARFHDGRPIESEDILFSLSRAVHPATADGDISLLPGPVYLREIVGADAVMRGEAEYLSGVQAVDARIVRIALEAPSPTFLMKLAATPAAILDRHQQASDPRWWSKINGSGPFRIASGDAEVEIALESTGSWLGNPIALNRVHIRLGLSAAQPVNLFQDDAIDLIPDVPPELVSLVRDPATGVDGAFLLEGAKFAVAYIALGNQRPPLDDVHIRRALQRVFPATRFAEAAFDGGVQPAEGIIPPGMLGREWLAEMPAVDAEFARSEIKRSRYGDAGSVPTVRIHAADIAPVEALRDVAQSALGLSIEAVQVNWFDFLAGLSGRLWDAYSLYWGVDYPDPEALLDVLFARDSAENYTGYSNPAFEELLSDARKQVNGDRREDIYAKAQQVLIDDAAVIPLYVPMSHTLARHGMSHVPMTPMGLLGLESLS